MAFCEGCGTALGEGANFCPKCGRAVGPPETASTATAVPPPAAAAMEERPPSPPTADATPDEKPKRHWRRYVFTLGVWAIVPFTGRLWRSGHRVAAVLIGGVSLLVVIVIIVAAANGGSNSSTNNPTSAPPQATTSGSPLATPSIPKAEKAARSWINDHGADSNRVQANILIVQVDVLAFQKSATQDGLNKVANDAQTAHDNLDAIRANFAGSYGTDTLGTAQLNAFSGANDLKNAMGALVAYTGDPNPATLAHFNAQYGQARAEWNQGVRTIWRLAKRKSPPTI